MNFFVNTALLLAVFLTTACVVAEERPMRPVVRRPVIVRPVVVQPAPFYRPYYRGERGEWREHHGHKGRW